MLNVDLKKKYFGLLLFFGIRAVTSVLSNFEMQNKMYIDTDLPSSLQTQTHSGPADKNLRCDEGKSVARDAKRVIPFL